MTPEDVAATLKHQSDPNSKSGARSYEGAISTMYADARQSVREIENLFIPLRDGTQLAARLWLPPGAESAPVPAILEYLPYRKRDGTSRRDESTYPVFAAAGYAGVRVDIRGTGESDGVIDDEYSPRELADAVEIIAWIERQPWCSGAVGMMGISWGGFNSLQVAALRPPQLKAVISIASTVDRYNDDIHYKNGCHLSANLSWAATMLCYASRPPDPAIVGESWRELWMARLADEPFLVEQWLAHQRRDDYWRHGSICEDFQAVQAKVMVIAGWADGYRNTPLKALEGLGAETKAMIGPWVHKYPHFAAPEPRMDFHAVALRWWDRWLKGVENGVEDEPALRAYMLDGIRPAPLRPHDPGRWIAEAEWPSRRIEDRAYHLTGSGALSAEPDSPSGPLLLKSPQDCGTAAGEYFTLKPDAEMAADQRIDDAGSLVFQTAPLAEPVEILGQPLLRLLLSIDAPLGNIIARIVDVHPDGAAMRVSFGVLNLAHRHGSGEPVPMVPGRTEAVDLRLDYACYRFPPGHRIRLSISTAYWPMVLPPPTAVSATIETEASVLNLPVRRDDGTSVEVPAPRRSDYLPNYRSVSPPATNRSVTRNLTSGLTRYHIHEDTGADEHPQTGLVTRTVRDETWNIGPDDPLSMTAHCRWVAEMSREHWSIRTVSTAAIACTAEAWLVSGTVDAFEGETLMHTKTWSRAIPRDHM